MPKLQEFIEAAKGEIVSGSYDHAINLCQDVLRHYPKHLEAHCLLAEAYRERGERQVAEDLFSRVLSADPENLVARWALSVLYQERGEREASLAQLRVALEMNPDHNELHKEVVKQSGDRVKPSTGGLARLYMRGGLFDRAAAEFRAALALEPQRLDLQLGLAEAEWYADNPSVAATLSSKILEESADCLKALLIAACVAANSGRPLTEAEASLWRQAHALDPENKRLQEILASVGVAVSSDRWDIIYAPADLPAPQDDALLSQLQSQLPEDAVPTAYLAEVSSQPQLEEASLPSADVLASDAYDQEERSWSDVHDDLLIGVPAASVEQIQQDGVREPAAVTASTTAEALPAADTSWLPTAVSEPEAVTAEGPAGAVEWGEWASLLSEEIALDPEAEGRLAAALADVQSPARRPEQTASGTSAARGHDELGNRGPSPFDDLIHALDVNPDDHAARLALAKGYQQLGQVDAALEQYRTVLRLAPELAGEIGDGLHEFLRSHPDHAEIHRALGDAYMKTGRFQQAIDEYNRGLNLEKAVR